MQRFVVLASRASLAGALALFGCSALIDPDPGRLGEPIDSGSPRLDAGGGGADAGPPVDAGRRPDAGRPGDAGEVPVDAGPGCTAAPRCEGEVRLYCEAGAGLAEDCASVGAFCQGGACVPWVCTPFSQRCETRGGGESSASCNARGSEETLRECARGCDETTGVCLDAGTCEDLPEIELGGDAEIDLCDQADAHTYLRAGDCGTSIADVGDQVFVLQITEPRTVSIELTDVDETAPIDTVVYLRRACADADSQLGCDDDVVCAASTVPGGATCTGGVDVRQSRLITLLEPGTYYVVADAHEYVNGSTRYGCGRVRLEVRVRP